MGLQYSVALRNNQLDQVESTVGTSAKLRLYSGSPPANCAAAATGTLLLDITLPADWMNVASGGTKTNLGAWGGVGTAEAGSGTTVGYFRVWDSAVSVCSVQGTATASGGGGDMTLGLATISAGQAVSVTSFVITAGGV